MAEQRDGTQIATHPPHQWDGLTCKRCGVTANYVARFGVGCKDDR